MLAASTHWSDLTKGQQIFGVYLLTGIAVMMAIQWYLRPRPRRGFINSTDWQSKGEGSGALYWTLMALGLHPISIVIGAVLWPIWLVAVLLLRFLKWSGHERHAHLTNR